MQARFYLPMYGRFASPDPARDQHFEETQSWNIYSYVKNNPVTHVDPNGMEDQPIMSMPENQRVLLEQNGMSPARANQTVGLQYKTEAIAGGTGVAVLATGAVAVGGGATAALTSLSALAKSAWNSLRGLLSLGSQAGPTASEEAHSASAQATTVIGHYPEYVTKAAELGTKPFSVPMDAWNKMTGAQQWAANQKFLDRAIANGNSFTLATPLEKVKPGSFYAREIQYLMSKGYELTKDGLQFVKRTEDALRK